MALDSHNLRTQVVHNGPARALFVQPDGTFYLGRHYNIYRSDNSGKTWTFVAGAPRSPARRMVEMSRLAGRALRHEIKAMAILSDGTLVASTRQGVYYARSGDPVLTPSIIDQQDKKAWPPLTMTIGPDDRVLWGEYNSQYMHNLPMRIYVSDDGGRSYEVARTFEAGSILHIHNLIYDEKLQHYWVLTGDHGNEPGIGRLSADF